MSIQETLLKIKGVGAGILSSPKWALSVKIALATGILASILSVSFFAGRITAFKAESVQGDIKIQYPPLVNNCVPRYQGGGKGADAPEDTPPAADGSVTSKHKAAPPKEGASLKGSFTASKTGKVYYPNGCSSVSRIKPENRIFFATAKDAEQSGYARSKTCK